MVEITDAERRVSEVVFGDRLGLAERFVTHLATTGIERGLLGPREVPKLWGRHVLNCAVVGELVSVNAHVADVGSGAGLPGLALAIARRDITVTLIEPLERRVQWLSEVISDLELSNVSVVRGRAEQVVESVNADVVTARAVSALSKLVQITIPLLHGQGEVLAIKGRSAGEELHTAAKKIRRLGGIDTSVVTAGAALLEDPTTVVRIVVEQTLAR
ncbi:16S rRNA (guanine(527)-N(7))-methyltransferase RsmG [Arthrobacter sp. H14]|uniref:16S rRNA (guanine(527)-N(7))-methyltransferase RsmG n=1 Tax=Arthrobacter sp. H14 TaxID=1312959 RepID=UPI00047EB0C3|nr:16S rRNA (guanine(527)-N(7))-methyltransferase RsmG [Arthrobacter sp. H14]